jgi:hypothetical protein
VAFPEGAGKIVLAPGGEVTDIELKLLPAAAHAVRGVLLNPDGTPAPKVMISLGEDLPPLADELVVQSKPDGTFEFPAVVDGEWRLTADAWWPGEVRLAVEQWIEMAGHTLDGVRLRLSPPLTVRGKVVMPTPHG